MIHVPPTPSLSVCVSAGQAVSALAVDHSGSRLISGSHDYNVRLYDFNGMKRDLQPFRKMDVPCGDHQVKKPCLRSIPQRAAARVRQ